MRVGALQIDHVAPRRARRRRRRSSCRAKEYALLAQLATEPTRVFTKHELLRDVWGFRCPARTRTLDSHACRLRRKLGAPATRSWSRTCGASATGSRADQAGEPERAA